MLEQTETGITAASRTLDRESAKIDLLGLAEDVTLLYAAGIPIREITRQLNAKFEEEGSEHTVSNSCVYRWIKTRPEEWQEEVRKLRQELLVMKIEEWENQAIDVRQKAADQLDELISDVLESGEIMALTKGGTPYKRELTMNEKKDLANIIMKRIAIQESGESMAGIGGEKGKRIGVNVNVSVDLVGQMRKKRTKKPQEKPEKEPLDVAYKDVTDEQ